MLKSMPMFEIEHKVKVHECDCYDQLKLSGILRLMEEVSSSHLDAMGLPYSVLHERQMVFVLIRAKVKTHCAPRCNDKIRIQTTPHQPKGVQFIRTVRFYNDKGELMISAYTEWVLMNPETRRPLRPKALGENIECLEVIDPDNLAGQEQQKAEIYETAADRIIHFTDIDCNRHLNNAVYGDILLDTLPFEVLRQKMVVGLEIHYQGESTIGQILTLKWGKTPDGGYEVVGENGKPAFAAIVHFTETKNELT